MDINTRGDIVDLLEKFYQKAFDDDLIGHFFTEVVPLNLETHIPQIADFWESVIFSTRGYRKNVMEIHQHIHALSAIKKEHLDRWVALFFTNRWPVLWRPQRHADQAKSQVGGNDDGNEDIRNLMADLSDVA